MTWKTTAAASGLMVVATWLASYAPVGQPREHAAAPTPARTESAAAEIQREADRLHRRMQQIGSYRIPQRNPFRFGTRLPAAAPPPAPVVAPPPVVFEAAPPPAPRLALAGIGEDVAGDQTVRTAIVSTSANVHLVAVGDTIEDTYKVAAIEADAVELVRLADGTSLRLTLAR